MTAQLTHLPEAGAVLDLHLDSWAAQDLIDLARQATAVLLERFTHQAALQEFSRTERVLSAGDWGAGLNGSESGSEECPPGAAQTQDLGPGSPPALQRAGEELSRGVSMLLTVLAGHVEAAFSQPALRCELLGLPEGRTAYRDALDYLRDLIKVGRHEARRCLQRAAQLVPRTAEMTGEPLDPRLPVLGERSVAAAIGMASVDLVAQAVTEARQEARLAGLDAARTAEIVAEGERTLTEQAEMLDTHSLRTLTRRWGQWIQAQVNPDGAEPTEAQKRHHQGMFYVGPRHGLHQWLINADQLQHEIPSTVARAANHPRSPQSRQEGLPLGAEGQGDPAPRDGAADCASRGADEVGGSAHQEAPEPRSARQRHLDGIVSALSGALALGRGNGLPDSGGAAVLPRHDRSRSIGRSWR